MRHYGDGRFSFDFYDPNFQNVNHEYLSLTTSIFLATLFGTKRAYESVVQPPQKVQLRTGPAAPQRQKLAVHLVLTS